MLSFDRGSEYCTRTLCSVAVSSRSACDCVSVRGAVLRSTCSLRTPARCACGSQSAATKPTEPQRSWRPSDPCAYTGIRDMMASPFQLCQCRRLRCHCLRLDFTVHTHAVYVCGVCYGFSRSVVWMVCVCVFVCVDVTVSIVQRESRRSIRVRNDRPRWPGGVRGGGAPVGDGVPSPPCAHVVPADAWLGRLRRPRRVRAVSGGGGGGDSGGVSAAPIHAAGAGDGGSVAARATVPRRCPHALRVDAEPSMREWSSPWVCWAVGHCAVASCFVQRVVDAVFYTSISPPRRGSSCTCTCHTDASVFVTQSASFVLCMYCHAR
jgi:hypothetical protein